MSDTAPFSEPDPNAAAAKGLAALPQRRKLPHGIPSWVPAGATFFITVCALPRGENSLCRENRPTRLLESILHRREIGRWWPKLVVLMPDHVHGLLCFPPRSSMTETLADWKHFTARQLGIVWQRGFFDHRLRSDEALVEKAHYIRMNPVRAGLAAKPEGWPHVWSW